MAGCFGNHPVDRWMEEQLFRHLEREEQESKCERCKYTHPSCGAQEDEDFFTEEGFVVKCYKFKRLTYLDTI